MNEIQLAVIFTALVIGRICWVFGYARGYEKSERRVERMRKAELISQEELDAVNESLDRDGMVTGEAGEQVRVGQMVTRNEDGKFYKSTRQRSDD